ncbi:MAG: hypothetical protein H6999_10580 [Hahellaceae bacterium]|nr:hypothetical protein [Hahellaceae bacterium]MCP5170186.1 hypothetical protein [Hahellaceae bacterium]
MTTHKNIVFVFLLNITALFQVAHADEPFEFETPPTRLITLSDIQTLKPLASVESIKAVFGEPLRAGGIAIGWPKQEHAEAYSENEQWKRAYWFFFQRGKSGRPEHPLKLEYVASLKDDVKDISDPLLDLIPKMTIDWPTEKAGESLMQVYFGVAPSRE